MYEHRKELYSEIEKFTDSKVICYVTGDRPNSEIQIGNDVLDHFVAHLHKIGISKKISLILYSRGGNTLTGWSIVNLLKQFCEEFQVIIPSKAHSTATLIALGASTIMMTKQATLGPIDPSVNGPLNPPAPGQNPLARIPVSVESINGYLEFAKSAGVRDEDMVKVVIDLASKLHPLVLGDVYRSRSQIKMLGTRLLSNHIEDMEKIGKIVDFLCSESGSHDYTIYRREARNELGLNIATPNDEQYDFIKRLHDDYSAELCLSTPFDPNALLTQAPQQPQMVQLPQGGQPQQLGQIPQVVQMLAPPQVDYTLVRGLVESVEGGTTRFVTKGTLKRVQLPVASPIPQFGVEDQRTFEGWTNV